MKNRLLIAILISGFIFNQSCQEQQRGIFKEGGVVLCGKVHIPDSGDYSRIIEIDVFNLLTNESYNGLCFIDEETNEFRFDFNLYHQQEVIVKYGQVWTRLLLKPNDSLYMEFDAHEFCLLDASDNKAPVSLKISGTSGELNKELSLFFETYYEWIDEIGYIEPKDSDVEFRFEVDNWLREMNARLDSYIYEENPNEVIVKFARNHIRYYAANDFMYSYPREYLGKSFDFNEVITDLFPINNSEAFSSSMYRSYISGIFNLHEINQRKVIPLINDGRNCDAYRIVLDSILLPNFDGVFKEVVLSQFVNILFQNNPECIESIYSDITDEIENVFIKEELERNYERACIPLEESQLSFDQLFEKILQINRGKVLYIDVWATWCAPCINQMKYSHELLKRFEGSEFQVIYLCIDSQKPAWEQRCKDFHLNPDACFLLNDEQSKDLRKEFITRGIPHYILIDKNGQIVQKSAKFPSNPDLIIDIQELL